ncbi:hypothetical protein B0T17DRAFT_612383 [Bombardia bombarda]|uniref:DNA polymerase n=1 Tax=Bombardia bombarda TaxID=252184 RepID=A0AA39XKW3_9PEZI|nr:hypothetical protein B0T17DRAFT_612383 [Bombardia bombarda]
MTLNFPVTFLLPAHLGSDELQKLEEQIPTLTYDIKEAEVIVGKVFRKERALFELRKQKLITEEVSGSVSQQPQKSFSSVSPRLKQARVALEPGEEAVAISDTDSDATTATVNSRYRSQRSADASTQQPATAVKVVNLAWLTDSVKAGEVLPLDGYLIYEGRKPPAAPATAPMKPPPPPPKPPVAAAAAADIMKRALADADASKRPRSSHGSGGRRSGDHVHYPIRPALLHQTTSEHDIDLHLPPIPDYLHTTYSCQRPTPIHPPNEAFIDALIKIRAARTLMGDKIGVRAYSSAIATLSAYPYTLSTANEVARLPGCGSKIAVLYQEFKETGELEEAKTDEADPRLSVLKLFYEIWGVAETTAREFYNKGWRDLDDVVEYGWDSLTRVQQIGVKYYDEFQLKIPRAEVESISNTILKHANKVQRGFQMVIVGGYRRGKLQSGDVDVVLSHPDESATREFVERIVASLERAGYITHTLILSTTNTERGQTPVSWKGNEKKAGTGFDTLDKALVVWQDPKWMSGEAKNPNPHRRVDIIISPWKTAGCAVLGWTSGTTFQRDLRRYCKKGRSLKFDSSGIRSRADGSWVDFESGPDREPAPDMLTAERRVFAGLELEWRPPEERCTG